MEREDWISVENKLPELEQMCLVTELVTVTSQHTAPYKYYRRLVGQFLAGGVWDDGEYEISTGPNVWWMPVVDPIEIEEG